MKMKTIYESRIGDNRFNTSYPLSPGDWKTYETHGELPFAGNEVCFYIHIPFCKRLCSFCEYTRMQVPDEKAQLQYIDTLSSDIDRFLDGHPHVVVHGFDIGGGTPTSLTDKAFERLLSVFKHTVAKVSLADDFEPSIEATTGTLSPEKLAMISDSGIRRLSMGLQTTDSGLLRSVNRENEGVNVIANALSTISKVNLDLMYGLLGQNTEMVKRDIEAISRIRPQQVTLYEYRTNQLRDNRQLGANLRYDIYCLFFDALTHMGYHARFGQNTFSLDATDFGVSSYLRNRMLNGMPYKGFGLSAQSMSEKGLSYNIGKNSSRLEPLLNADTYENQSYYKLPPTEVLNKFICISAYSGGFSISRASEILGTDFQKRYSETIDFLLENGLIFIDGDRIQTTREGFRNYGAVFSMFTTK